MYFKSMYFIITTNREVAEQIERQCALDEKMGNRSYKLGQIRHEPGHSVVQIVAKRELIDPSDIFWLGHFSASNNLPICTCGSEKYGYGYAKCFSCSKLKNLPPEQKQK